MDRGRNQSDRQMNGHSANAGIDLGAISVFVIARDAERTAEVFGQRRLAEQAGLFESSEVGRSRRLANPHSARKAGVVT
jgi:hypothetical protein